VGPAQRFLARGRAREEREKKVPSAALFDAQSLKVANHPGVRGYDAGKKIRGRKRHLVVDTLGLILGVVVTAASVSDRAGALEVLPAVLHSQPRLEVLFAAAGYAGGTLAEPLRAHAAPRELRLEIVKRSDSAPQGFQVQPKRWLVERTFGWLLQARRLARDYQTKPASSEALIMVQASRIILRRLAR
jgi:transposase